MSGIVGISPNMKSGGLVHQHDNRTAQLNGGFGQIRPFPYDSGFRDITGYQPVPAGVSGVTTQRGNMHRIGSHVWYTCTCHCETQADENLFWFEVPFRVTNVASYQPFVALSYAQDSGSVQDLGSLSSDHAAGAFPHYNDYNVKMTTGGSATGFPTSGSRTFYWSISYEAQTPLIINTGGTSGWDGDSGEASVGFTSAAEWAY